MSDIRTSARPARQPFTFAGVARFAHAGIARLILVAFLFGCIAGLASSWMVSRCWVPVIDDAVAALPTNSSIQSGALRWPERSGRLLAANPFLALEVIRDEFRTEVAPVDLALELRTNTVALRSLFGTSTLPYPPFANFKLNSTTLVPTWGAWRSPALVALIPTVALSLMLTWAILAVPYSILALLVGGIFGRDLSFGSAWKLSVAAQFSGCLIMAFSLFLYGSGQVSLLFFLIMFAAHFIPTLLYLLISPILVPKKITESNGKPRSKSISGPNPFDNDPAAKVSGKNPFAKG